MKRNLLLLSYLPAYKVFPEPVRRSYLRAYKAPFYVSFCTFYASLRLTRTVFTRPKTSVSSVPSVAKNPFNLRNPRLINDLRLFKALYNCRETFTDVMSALQIKLFMQNKAKFRKVKLNVNKVLTKDYEQKDTWSGGKKQSQTNPNKPNSNPNKPNFSKSIEQREQLM